MIKVYGTIQDKTLEFVEECLYEIAPHNWVLNYNHSNKVTQLEGFFNTEKSADDNIKKLSKITNFDFYRIFSSKEISDEDWKNSYKKHFKPWNINKFHWVPIWYKETYSVPNEEIKIFLDPGMAFGTGNHETTKLCLESMVSINKNLREEEKQDFIDVGSGSGILALTASALGFDKVCAVDNDEVAIKVSKENAALNSFENIKYISTAIQNLQVFKKYGIVVANIQADILVKNANRLIELVRPMGYLLLSGILVSEKDFVHSHFENMFKTLGMKITSKKKTMNEWSLSEFQILGN